MRKNVVLGTLICLGLFGLLVADRGVAKEGIASETPSRVPATDLQTTPAESHDLGSLCRAQEATTDPATSADSADRVAPFGNWDPGTCGGCGDFCSSDAYCTGKLLGHVCNNMNWTCQARTGCALFNCCDCVPTNGS